MTSASTASIPHCGHCVGLGGIDVMLFSRQSQVGPL